MNRDIENDALHSTRTKTFTMLSVMGREAVCCWLHVVIVIVVIVNGTTNVYVGLQLIITNKSTIGCGTPKYPRDVFSTYHRYGIPERILSTYIVY